MKISELMEQLGEIQGKIGDVDVMFRYERGGVLYYTDVLSAREVVGSYPAAMLSNRSAETLPC